MNETIKKKTFKNLKLPTLILSGMGIVYVIVCILDELIFEHYIYREHKYFFDDTIIYSLMEICEELLFIIALAMMIFYICKLEKRLNM